MSSEAASELPWKCAGCGAEAVARTKPCDCITNCGYRMPEGGKMEHTTFEPFGPTRKTTFHCHGCPMLITEDWEFHEEDDGIDRGTDAKCTAMTPPKHIASYWDSHDHAPDWCPAKPTLGEQP